MTDIESEEEDNIQSVRMTIELKSNGHADYPWEISFTSQEKTDFKDVSHAGWQLGITAMYALLNFAKAYPHKPKEFAQGMVSGMNEVITEESYSDGTQETSA